MPLILSGNVASAIGGGYEVDNSLRFESGSGDYIRRENTGTDFSASGSKLFTYSVWVKRAKLGSFQQIYAIGSGAGRDYTAFDSSDRIEFAQVNSGVQYQLTTTRVFRDISAWYHLVFAVDTTNGTANNRLRLYVNGTEETVFTTRTNPSSSLAILANTQCDSYVLGADTDYNNDFSGYFSEVCYVSGSQETATPFGEFDEDSPTIWKPKKITATLASDSFYYEFKNSGAVGTDTSGLGNTAGTINGLTAADQATDTPTNNFCTMNPLDNFYYDATFSEGNLKLAQPSDTECYPTSTIAVSQGKWYWEIKITSSGSSKDFVGIADKVATASDFSPFSGNSNMLSYYGSNGDSKAGSTGTSYGATFTTGDIIGVAMDLDNNKLYFSKNGSFQDSGDPTSGATGTGALSINASPADGVWYAQFSNIHNTASTFEANFGNPTFTISSGNADDNGYGNFEYDVPSGYYALCTKNLAEYG